MQVGLFSLYRRSLFLTLLFFFFLTQGAKKMGDVEARSGMPINLGLFARILGLFYPILGLC
jgi:hypothetical protein